MAANPNPVPPLVDPETERLRSENAALKQKLQNAQDWARRAKTAGGAANDDDADDIPEELAGHPLLEQLSRSRQRIQDRQEQMGAVEPPVAPGETPPETHVEPEPPAVPPLPEPADKKQPTARKKIHLSLGKGW